ncbi:MAG: DUF4065 domain-containing protein [Proteobacteria bacterium]|nr:DUF4065 domain-containing protein [Pseudomonadota bacterium]
MAVTSLSAAKLICKLSNWSVTNLKLQKILYIAHMFHMGKNDGAPLVEGEFEAWDYGPVEPSVYKKVKMFGSDPIEDVFFGVPDVESDSLEYESLNSACDTLLEHFRDFLNQKRFC